MYYLYHNTLRRNLDFKLVSSRYNIFHYTMFNRKEYELEIYSESVIFFCLSNKEKSFLSSLHCQCLPCPFHLGTHSLAIWHCQPRYWIYIHSTYLMPTPSQRAELSFALFTKLFLPFPGHMTLSALWTVLWLQSHSVNIFPKVFLVCWYNFSKYSRAEAIFMLCIYSHSAEYSFLFSILLCEFIQPLKKLCHSQWVWYRHTHTKMLQNIKAATVS